MSVFVGIVVAHRWAVAVLCAPGGVGAHRRGSGRE